METAPPGDPDCLRQVRDDLPGHEPRLPPVGIRLCGAEPAMRHEQVATVRIGVRHEPTGHLLHSGEAAGGHQFGQRQPVRAGHPQADEMARDLHGRVGVDRIPEQHLGRVAERDRPRLLRLASVRALLDPDQLKDAVAHIEAEASVERHGQRPMPQPHLLLPQLVDQRVGAPRCGALLPEPGPFEGLHRSRPGLRGGGHRTKADRVVGVVVTRSGVPQRTRRDLRSPPTEQR